MTAYRYIDTPDALGAAIDRLAHEPLLGVDTEAAGYHRYLDRISLIQISSRTETVLVDPLALDDLSGLSRLLGRDAIETVFHDADFDLRILDHLQGHGRASNLELAEAASLSPAQCHRRHRRLEEAGYVRRYETRLNAARLGLTVVAFIHVSMERSHIRELDKFKDLLGNLAEVQECYSVTGDFDYVLKVTDAATFTAPVELTKTWIWRPEVTRGAYECRRASP